MSVQAINQQALGPAAKGLDAGSGRANSLAEAQVSQQAAEAEARSRVKKSLLERRETEAAIKLPAATHLEFSLDPEHKRVFIKVSDSRTGQVILEIPPEKVAKAIDQLLETVNGPKIDFEA